MKREFDIIVFGASGFTGKHVCKLMNKKKSIKWAAAGRQREKVQALLEEMGCDPNIPIIEGDVHDQESLGAICRRTTVLIDCVGPFILYGEPVVQACIEYGCNYVDITGEPEYVARLIKKYHQLAKEKEVTIVPVCGFDCIPSDIGILAIRKELHRRKIIPSSVEMFFETRCEKGITLNIGTLESVLQNLGDLSQMQSMPQLYKDVKVPYVGKKLKLNFLPHYDSRVKKWVIPFLGADSDIVKLTHRLAYAGQTSEARPYPPTQFTAYIALSSFIGMVLLLLGMTFVGIVAQFRDGKKLLLKHPKLITLGFFSREGPSAEQIKHSSFVSTFFVQGYSKQEAAANQDPPDVRLKAYVMGPDMGYVTTPICVVNSALTILELKESSGIPNGVLTPAAAFAKTDIIERLGRDGLSIKVE